MPSSPVNDPFQTDRTSIARRRAIADALQGQALSPIQTQMMGGVAVPNSPLAGITKLAQALVARKGMDAADSEERALSARIQERRGADLSLLTGALSGRQGSAGGLQEDASGNVTQMDPTASMTPAQALTKALPMIQDPTLQQAGLGVLAKHSEPFTLNAGDVRFGPGGMLAAAPTKPASEKSFKAGDIRKVAIGENEVTQEYQPDGSWKEIATGPRFAKQVVTPNAPERPFYTAVGTPGGVMAFNSRTGKMEPAVVGGKPVVKSSDDPTLQGRIADAKAGGKETGESRAQAQIDLPRVVNNAQNSLQLIDQLVGSEDGKVKAHPGFQTSVGAGLGVVTKRIPGTEAAGFHALLDQVKGGAFLEAFNSLKGGGQITEVEGKKATDAITRMQTSTKESEFIAAAREYQGIIRKGVERAQGKAGYSGPERRGVPEGVDPQLWSVMTPEERALWAQ